MNKSGAPSETEGDECRRAAFGKKSSIVTLVYLIGTHSEIGNATQDRLTRSRLFSAKCAYIPRYERGTLRQEAVSFSPKGKADYNAICV